MGWEIDPESDASIRSVVERLLEAPDELAECRARLRAVRDELSWQVEEQELARVIAGVLERPGGSLTVCGLAGIVDARGVDARALVAMTDALAHRGPDGEGYAGLGRRAAGARAHTRGARLPCPARSGWDWVIAG